MKHILITGATGFIGSHICEYLVENYPDYHITAIDDLSGSTGDNINHLTIPLNDWVAGKKGLNFLKVDLRDERSVKTLFEASPAIHDDLLIFHLASAAHENRSFFTPNENMSRNDQAYRTFLTQAIKYGLKKVVMYTSMARYGHGSGHKPPFSEDLPTNPADPYAISKVAMEQFTKCMSDVFGFDYTIVVPHNVFGENQYYCDPYRNVIAIWMNLILQNRQPVIFGNGEQTRAFSYIGNNIKPMVECMFGDNTSKEVFNIGAEQQYSLKQAWDIVKKVSGTKLNARFENDRPGEVKHAYCTTEKSEIILGYKEEISFEEGISKMWDWIKDKGPQDFKFMESLEIENESVPRVWLENF
jgi:UDP-glucose 4-epimerase